MLRYSLNQQEIEVKIYQTPDKHTNYYTTEVVVLNKYFMKWLNVFDNISGMIFFRVFNQFQLPVFSSENCFQKVAGHGLNM